MSMEKIVQGHLAKMKLYLRRENMSTKNTVLLYNDILRCLVMYFDTYE